VSELESQFLKQSEHLERSEGEVERWRAQAIRRQEELTSRERDIADIRSSVQEMDTVNAALQQRLGVFEREQGQQEVNSSRKEEEVMALRRRQEQLQNDLRNSSMENRSLAEELGMVRREVEALKGVCQGVGDRSEHGMTSLAQLTRNMESRQVTGAGNRIISEW